VPNPNNTVKLIEKWRDAKQPVHFTVTGTTINFDVTIRDFSYEPEKGGTPGDIDYSLTLKEYRHPTVKTATVSTQSISVKVRPSASKPKVKTYIVKSGDCLWKIALREYGTGSKDTVIYNANKKVIGTNPNLIYPGQKLVIP
jgi:nucleoid-associated protein YgaU